MTKETHDSKNIQKIKMNVKIEFKKPDGGYGWIILFVAFSVSFVLDGCMYSFGIVLQGIKDHFKVSQEIANLVPSLNTGFLFLSGTVSSALAKQFGCRLVVMISSLIFSLMYLISAFLPSIYIMKFTFGIIGGISFGCAYLTCFIILVDYFDKKLGLANGLTMAGSGLGAFAFAPFTDLLVNSLGWKYTMIILGGLIFICFFLGALLRPIEYYKKIVRLENETNESDNLTSEESSLESNKQKQTIGEIIKEIVKEMTNFKLLKENTLFLLIALSNFFIFFVYFIPFIYIPIRAKSLNITQFAWLISIIGIVNIPMRILFGIICDRKIIQAIHMNTLCVFLSAISMFVYFYLTTFYSQAILAVLFAIASAGMNCLSTPYLVDIVGSHAFANGNGILNMFRGLSCFFGPFIAGFISEATGTNLFAFIFCASSFTIAALLSLIVSVKTIQNNKSKKKPIEIAKI